MTDGISFDITANDKTASGVNSAIGNIRKLGQDAFGNNLISSGGKFGSILAQQAKNANLSSMAMYNLAESTGMWKSSQLATAAASQILTRRSAELINKVKAGKMTTEEAGKAYKNYANEMDKMVWGSMSFGEKFKAVGEKIKPVTKELANIGAAGVAVGFTAKKLYDFAKSGAELEYTKTRFDRLSVSMGTTGDVMLNRLRVATKGTVSDMQLARQGADLFQLGLADTADEAVRLSKVQTALGMDTGELTLALANQSKRRLDQLGLSLSTFNKIEKKLKDSGMSKEAAFKEAFLQTAEQTISTTGNRADSNAGNFARLEASGANLWDTAKLAAPNMGLGWMFGGDTVSETANKVSMFLGGVGELIKGNNVLDLSGGLGADSWVRQAQVQDKSSLWANKGRDYTKARGGGAITGLSALQSYTAMAYKYGQPSGGPQAAGEGAQIDYATLTEAALKLTSANDSYLQSLAEINTAQDNGKISVAEQTAAMQELEIQTDKQSEAYALNLLQQNEALDPKKLYDFASASGLMTKQAADQATAQANLADAYSTGQISAETYAAAVKMISGDLSALNGQTATSFINIVIKTNGAAVNVPPGTGLDQSTIDMINAQERNAHGHAGGGKLKGGEWSLLGDAPGGRLTPYSEAVGPDGDVYDAQTTKWLFDNGFLNGVVSRAGGTAGGRPASRSGAGSTRRKISATPSTKVSIPSLSTLSTTALDSQQNGAAEAQMQQTTQAQTDANNQVAALLQETNDLLRKQATKTDLANLYNHGQKTQV